MVKEVPYHIYGGKPIKTGEKPRVSDNRYANRPDLKQESGIITFDTVFNHVFEFFGSGTHEDSPNTEDFYAKKIDFNHREINYQNRFTFMQFSLPKGIENLVRSNKRLLSHQPTIIDITVPAGKTTYKKSGEQSFFVSQNVISPHDSVYEECTNLAGVANDFLRSLNSKSNSLNGAFNFYQRGVEMTPIKDMPMGLTLKVMLASHIYAGRTRLEFPVVDF